MSRTRIFPTLLIGAAMLAPAGCGLYNPEGPTNDQLGDHAVTDGFSQPNFTESNNVGDDDGDLESEPLDTTEYQTQAEYDQFLELYNVPIVPSTYEMLELLASYDNRQKGYEIKFYRRNGMDDLTPIRELSDGILFKRNAVNNIENSSANYVIWRENTNFFFESHLLHFQLDSLVDN